MSTFWQEVKASLFGQPVQVKADTPAGAARVGIQGRPEYPSVDPRNLQLAYSRNELVYACLNIKATAAVDPRLLVETRQGGDWTQAEGHPMRRLMMRPNPMDDEASFMRALIISWDITRKVFVEVVRSRAGAPIQLWPLDPTRVFEVWENGVFVAYEWRDGGQPLRFAPEQLLVRKSAQWHDPSPLAVAMGSVDADSAQTDYVRAFFNNAGVPSGILKVKGSYDQPRADALRAAWRAKYGRSWGKQHDVAVLDENADYQQIGANLDQLESETVRGVTESRICMAFGVPPLIVYAYVGLLRATYSNLKEAWSSFWDASMSPSFKQWKSWLTWNLLTEFESTDRIYAEQVRLAYDYSEVQALQDDVQRLHQRARENFRTGGITLNEFRQQVGQAPDASGDYYLRLLAYAPYVAGHAPVVVADDVLAGKQPQPAKALPRARQAKAATAQQRIEAKIAQAAEAYLAEQYERAAQAVEA